MNSGPPVKFIPRNKCLRVVVPSIDPLNLKKSDIPELFSYVSKNNCKISGDLSGRICTYVEKGVDPEYGKNVFDGKLVGPYLARAMKPSIHHTMGGLAIDTSCHVLDKTGKIISGFYAAGEVAGGVNAGNRLGGNALAAAFTFGRIAGANAAAGQ